MSSQVTATGIKDGDPAVLRALVDRRGAAVLAYCERACSPSLVLEAVSDAFARFRAAVIAVERPTDLHPEIALLSATRTAAAARSPRPPAPPVPDPNAGLGRLLASTASVEIVPELLLRRADGRLTEAEEAVLDDLLSSSPVARALEERFAAAEEAYRTAPREPLPGSLGDTIVRTMAESTGPIPVSAPPVYQDHTVEFDALEQPPAEAPAAVAAGEPDAAPVPPRFERDPDEGSGFFPRRLRRRKKDEVPAAEVEPGPTFTPFPEFTPAEATAPEPAFEPTMEWQVPDESADEQLAAEAEAADLVDEQPELEPEAVEPEPEPVAPEPVDETVEFEAQEEPEHVQSASGAVDETVEFDAMAGEPDVEEPADLADPEDDAGPPDEQEPDAPAENEDEMAADDTPRGDDGATVEAPALAPTPPPPAPVRAPAPAHAHGHDHHRPSFPGRTALVPALAVIVIAAIGAMAASGVFGGNDPSPPLDTGIVPERAQQAVPEGEAASVVDELRAASAEARRQRLADQRREIAAGIAQPELGTSDPDIVPNE